MFANTFNVLFQVFDYVNIRQSTPSALCKFQKKKCECPCVRVLHAKKIRKLSFTINTACFVVWSLSTVAYLSHARRHTNEWNSILQWLSKYITRPNNNNNKNKIEYPQTSRKTEQIILIQTNRVAMLWIWRANENAALIIGKVYNKICLLYRWERAMFAANYINVLIVRLLLEREVLFDRLSLSFTLSVVWFVCCRF